MLIRLGYDIQFFIPAPVAMVALLHVHPGRSRDLQEPDILSIDPVVPVEQYLDGFGNLCSRFLAPPGPLHLSGATVIKDSGLPDPVYPEARQVPIDKLPAETLQYLLNSRYCEVDRLSNIATDLFGDTAPGWARVQEICDWVHSKVTFGYHFARSNKTALDVYKTRRLPRLPTPGDYILPVHEYTRSLCNRIFRRYRSPAFGMSDGFQRLV
jgi:transglutaminase-like putative cysteine protease